LESAVRNCDNFQVTKADVEKILDWENNQILQDGVEVAFKPARVILQVKKSLQNFYILSILSIDYKLLLFIKLQTGLYWSTGSRGFCCDERCCEETRWRS